MAASTSTEAARPARRRRSAVRSLPLAEWPPADRQAWEDACRPGNRLTRGGAASHLAAVTRKDLAQRYGYFLDFRKRTGQLDGAAEAAALVTPEAIDAFIAELRSRVSSVTLAGTIYKIRRMANLIAPARDMVWLTEIEKDLALLACPKDKSARVVACERLVAAGLTLIAEADLADTDAIMSRALTARNGLMIALLTTGPIRLRNFAALEIGHSFIHHQDTWWIVLHDTKSGRPDERPVPVWLNEAIERYLTTHRPVLLAGRRAKHAPPGQVPKSESVVDGPSPHREGYTGALWIGHDGRPLSRAHVARCLSVMTKATVGVEVSPHLFRASAATCAALNAPEMPHLATALLHQRHWSVTETHYNRANSLSVAADYARLIRSLRSGEDV